MTNLKSLKRILYLLITVTIIVFVAFYFVFTDIKSKNEKISSISQTLLTETDKQEYLITTQRLIESISGDLEKIDSYIVPKDGDVAFIENLESLAKSNNLSITIDSLAVEDLKDTDSKNITTLKIRAKTKGKWEGTYRLISQLESLPYRLGINNFSMLDTTDIPAGGKRNTNPGANWQSSFEIQVLKYK